MDKIYYIPTSKKILSLTFDDGPTFNTYSILDILKSYNIKATFFVLMRTVVENKDILKQIIKDGHNIGLHGFDHRSLSKHNPSYIKKIIQESLQYLKENFGINISYIRPPFGTITQYGDALFKELGLTQIGWSVMTKDWYTRYINDKSIKIISNCQPGKIIVLHDGLRTNCHVETGAPKILNNIIPHLVQQQYSFVDIPSLINSYNPNLTQIIGRHHLFSASHSISNNVLRLELLWNVATIKPNQTFKIKVVDGKQPHEPIILPFPDPMAMKEWFIIHEIKLKPCTKLIDIYIKTRRRWIKINNP